MTVDNRNGGVPQMNLCGSVMYIGNAVMYFLMVIL